MLSTRLLLDRTTVQPVFNVGDSLAIREILWSGLHSVEVFKLLMINKGKVLSKITCCLGIVKLDYVSLQSAEHSSNPGVALTVLLCGQLISRRRQSNQFGPNGAQVPVHTETYNSCTFKAQFKAVYHLMSRIQLVYQVITSYIRTKSVLGGNGSFYSILEKVKTG